MVKMTVRQLELGHNRTFFGSEQQLEEELRDLFPSETENAHRLMACVEAVNEAGFAEVEVEPYKTPPERNMLPPDYDTAPQHDDPWVREEP